MKRIFVSLLIATQLAVALPSFADPTTSATVTLPTPPPPAPGEPDVGAAISPMKKGQVAPFTGILLSPRATAVLITQINTMQDQIKVEVDHARAEEQARCDFRVNETTTKLETDKKILQAQLTDASKRVNILTAQLKTEEDNRPNMPLWAGLSAALGVVVGVGLSALTVFAMGAAAK